jgi:prepilin-type N-terminal cleavage/methylation domain-containing protein
VRRAGFTLVEAIVALTLSSILVVLVSTVFLVQNRFYAVQVARSQAHDNARMMTDVMSSELRSLAKGAVKVARGDRLSVRSPVVLAVVCAHSSGQRVSVHFDGGASGVDTGEVTGVAVRDTITGEWSYYDAGSWDDIGESGGHAERDCAGNGADTTGASGEFVRLHDLDSYMGSLPAVGQLLMLYREVEYRIGASEMDPSALALYRTVAGGSRVEFATGVDPSAGFLYRVAGRSYYRNRVYGGSLEHIDAIRLVAEARQAPRAGGADPVEYGWSVNVILRNGG